MARRATETTPGSSQRRDGGATAAVSKLRPHRECDRVPAMRDQEFAAFRADVSNRGILEPLDVTATGVVLDGRHRLRAACELGIVSVPVRVIKPDDPVAHMLCAALQRRHLSQSQKAAVALELDLCQQERARADRRRHANLRQHTEVATLPPRRQRTRDLAARIAGVSPRTMQDVITVYDGDRDLYEQIKAGDLPAHTARRQLERTRRYAELDAAPALPPGRFELIYADPPWQLGNPDSDYAPEQYYPTLPLDEIARLAIPAAEDAVLYLWAVNSHLPDAFEVMAAWGFEYRSCETWVKPSIGMGVWTRNRHELLLIGRRGNASPAPRKRLLDSVIEAPRGRHSEKPSCVYERLEHLYPKRTKVELFARGKPRPGWTAWGNEVDHDQAA